MTNKYPCEWYEDSFWWTANCIWIEDTWEYKYVVMPENDICNACDSFKKCCEDLIKEIKDDYEGNNDGESIFESEEVTLN